MELKGKLQGLDWLVEEVEATLQQASEALEAYVADPDDESQIRFCLGYIHEVSRCKLPSAMARFFCPKKWSCSLCSFKMVRSTVFQKPVMC